MQGRWGLCRRKRIIRWGGKGHLKPLLRGHRLGIGEGQVRGVYEGEDEGDFGLAGLRV